MQGQPHTALLGIGKNLCQELVQVTPQLFVLVHPPMYGLCVRSFQNRAVARPRKCVSSHKVLVRVPHPVSLPCEDGVLDAQLLKCEQPILPPFDPNLSVTSVQNDGWVLG